MQAQQPSLKVTILAIAKIRIAVIETCIHMIAWIAGAFHHDSISGNLATLSAK